MSRPSPGVMVVGAGIVGAALALGLRRRGIDVMLLDAAPPAVWRADQPDLRVYALAPDAEALLRALGVWDGLRLRRVSPYTGMQVVDAGGAGCFHVEALAHGVTHLGHIVEHALLAERLQSALVEAGVLADRDARLEHLASQDDAVVVRFADGRTRQVAWVFGADGARSAVREAAGIGTEGCDYGASGLVAYLRCERPHQATCWQRFLPTGPLALLPCVDGRVSIVWSLPEAEAQRLLVAPTAGFDAEVTRSSNRVLGRLALDSERRLFPLRRQLATRMHEGRVALLGDAAHVVHPLAGQGVNLGLRDVAGLLAAIDAAHARGAHLTPARLARWSRGRYSENALAAHAFDAIHRIYSNDAMLPLALRGAALAAANLPPLQRVLWRRAAGLA